MKAYLLAIIAIVFVSCSSERNDCLKSTGKVRTERRDLSAFTELVLERRLNVIIVEDSLSYVEVEAGENLLGEIITEVEGNSLRIGNRNTCNFMRSFKIPVNIRVHAPGLRWITMLGTSYLSSETVLRNDSITLEFIDSSSDVELSVDNIYMNVVQHTGASDVIINGKTFHLDVYMSGLAYADYSRLSADYAYVYSKSSAACSVFTTGSMHLKNEGDGTIYYRGIPLELLKKGRGDVVPY